MQFTYSPEVAHALTNNLPVVALESTIITHGMPYPQNLTCAQEVEAIVRQQDATPATIAIIQGQVHIGLTPEKLEYLARQGQKVHKVSRRDLAAVIARKADGATTVAATMILADRAKIAVFATGGIGGVHQGAVAGLESTLDISADLTELQQTPVTVVCAGVKSILHVGQTLELLETLGVGVYGWQTDRFPDFFTADSGFAVAKVASAVEVAAMMRINQELKLKMGLLVAVANPAPAEPALIAQAIAKAHERARIAKIQGKAVTPFLLQAVTELTGGESLRANLALIKNNARVAALIASQFAKDPLRGWRD